MRPRNHLPESIRRVARCQDGVVSRGQLLDAGLSPRVLARLTRDWPRTARGVYLVTGDLVGPTWSARVWTGVLLGGPGTRAAGSTAAALDGLAPDEPPGAIELLVPHGRTVTPHPGFSFRRERPGVRLPSGPAEPARTRIEDTTLDLCVSGPEREVVTWLSRACQRRLTTAERLARRARQRPRLRHRATVLGILQDVALGATTVLEHRALTTVLRPHGLPPFRMQHRTGPERMVDVAFVGFSVLIELDGRIGHVGEGAFRDRRRDNAHARRGWITLRFGWWEIVEDPCGVAAGIAAALADSGWPGEPTRCPDCH